MAYTVLELINEAYYLSGIVANTSQPTGAQQKRALTLLNSLLALKTSDSRLVPYTSTYNFNAVVGQQTYLIPKLIYADSVTFNLNTTIRLALMQQSRKQYWGSYRITNLSTLLSVFNLEPAVGGANLSVYPLPNIAYPISIVGRFSLNAVTKFTDLSAIFDGDYIFYLTFALSRYLCLRTNISFPPAAEMEYNKLEQLLKDKSALDLTVTKISTLDKGCGINYAIGNLRGGWI